MTEDETLTVEGGLGSIHMQVRFRRNLKNRRWLIQP